jgi:hypothetical protein
MEYLVEVAAERQGDTVAQPLPDHLYPLPIQFRVELEMLARMGSAHDVRYPILQRHFGHGHGDLDIAWSVVQIKQQMMVYIDHLRS